MAGVKPISQLPVSIPAELGSDALHRTESLLALGPRDSGTDGAARAARWLASALSASGLEPRIDAFLDATPTGSTPFRNVLAEWPGREPEWVVLLSHYDTKSGVSADFAGANDGGSSTGLLLALADLIVKRGNTPRRGVQFAFLDGEECLRSYADDDGLHGSKRLAAQWRTSSRQVSAVILLDMIGDAHLTFTVPRNSSPALKLLLFDAAQAQHCRDRVTLFESDILDDHQPFLDSGLPAIDLIDFRYGSRPGLNDYWHTPEDTLDKLSAASLGQVGAVVLEMLHRLEAY